MEDSTYTCMHVCIFVVYNTLYNIMKCWMHNYLEKEHFLKDKSKRAWQGLWQSDKQKISPQKKKDIRQCRAKKHKSE